MTYDNIKSHKKPGYQGINLWLEDTFCEKPQGIQIDPPPIPPSPSSQADFRVKIIIRFKTSNGKIFSLTIPGMKRNYANFNMTISALYNSMKLNNNYYRTEGDVFNTTIYHYLFIVGHIV